jgi:rhodanese-related sulfurtransferase
MRHVLLPFLLALAAPSTIAAPTDGLDGVNPWRVISTTELEALMGGGNPPLLVDVLPPIIHDQMHIPGSVNIPIGSLRASTRLPEDKEATIVFYCMGTLCMYSPKAARLAHEMGYRNLLVYREGILGWARSGRRLASSVTYPDADIPLVSARDLVEDADALKLDIRPADHFARGHVQGSVNLDLEKLHEYEHLLPRDRRIVLIDHKGKLTLTSGRFLALRGLARVSRLDGGFNAWVKTGLPVDRAVTADESMARLSPSGSP